MSGPHGPESFEFELTRIRDAAAAVRTYAGNIGLEAAELILPFWAGYRTLTEEQADAVLRRFKVEP